MRFVPRKLFLTRGVGINKEKLNSFEMALRNAGIAHLNIVRVSSIFPPGCKILSREQWLNGTRFDRFVTPVTLTTGRNALLVKICQGPQHKDPEVPNNWSLQLRLCDENGRGIEFKTVLPDLATGTER